MANLAKSAVCFRLITQGILFYLSPRDIIDSTQYDTYLFDSTLGYWRCGAQIVG